MPLKKLTIWEGKCKELEEGKDLHQAWGEGERNEKRNYGVCSRKKSKQRSQGTRKLHRLLQSRRKKESEGLRRIKARQAGR